MSNSRQLDDWLESFMEWTENSESPATFRLWTGISCIASVMQRKCYMDWGALKYYPNMYIILVGPSASRKGTAMAFGANLLSDIGIKLAAQSTTRQALIRRLKLSAYQHSDPVTKELCFHSSLSIFSEEFTVFLGYQNRELMADLCDWYDCKNIWTYETKNMGTDEIVGVWVNLIGATTPSLIRSTLPQDSIGGGLTSRMIFVFEEQKGKTVIFPSADPVLREALRNDLERIQLLNGRFSFTSGFFNAWTDWYGNIDNAKPFDDDRFDGYCGRRPTHMMKLSMICAASARHGQDLVVTEDDFTRARAILETTEKKMPQVFGGYGSNPNSELLQRVMTWLAMNPDTTEAALMQRFHRDADKRTMDLTLQTLQTMQCIVITHTSDGRKIKWKA